jgi:hypothetical protein
LTRDFDFVAGTNAMSVISAYKEPQDILYKLLREGRRTWRAADQQEKCDHFFNYCVTAHSLRDWCIKHLNLHGKDLSDFHSDMNSKEFFSECRDIANSSKHFGLDNKVSSVTAASPTVSDFAILTSNGVMLNGPLVPRPDINISLDDGTSVTLFKFLHCTSLGWIEVLKNKNIAVDEECGPLYIFY